jgi:periplasmic copper chaperone A
VHRSVARAGKRFAALALIAAALVVALSAPAWGHIDIDPPEALAGTTTTLNLTFHHGKDGTATTGLSVRLPAGTTLVRVPPLPGWAVAQSTDGGLTVVSWEGGRIPDGQEAAFPLEVTLPATPGEVLFPTVQMTEAGELAWIEPVADESETAKPAPRITLAANPDATTTTTAAPTTTTTAAPTTTAPSTTLDLPGTTNQAELRDDGDESAAPWLVAGGVAAAAMVGGGGWWLKRRS